MKEAVVGLRQTRGDIPLTIHLFREGKTYIAHIPEFDLSSCGDTPEKARRNIRDAFRGFVSASRRMGTLGEILSEAGYERYGAAWRAPEFVSLDRLTISIK